MGDDFRTWLGKSLIYIGVRVLPTGVRTMFTDTLLYHVPGMLTEERKAKVRSIADEWRRRRAQRDMAEGGR